MKLKAFSTLGVAAVLVLPFSIASANAETVAGTVSVVQEAVVASPDAVLVAESPVVGTVAAPVPEPAPVVVADPVVVQPPESVATPVASAPEPVAKTAVAAPVPAAVVAPEPAPAAAVVVSTVIAENPLCVGQNLFTVTVAGDCAAAPLGYTVADLRADALFELNSRNPVAAADQSTLDAFATTYVGGGCRQQPGTHTIHSASIPGVVYSFK